VSAREVADRRGVFVYFPNGPWYFAARPDRGSEVMLSAGNSLQ
jgi:hypothetical protein